MRQGNLIMKIISVVALLAIAFYIGYYFYDARVNPLKTALAIKYTAEDSVTVSGFIVRDEKVLFENEENVSVIKEDGDKVAKNEAVAVVYQNTESLKRATQMKETEQQISQIDTQLNGNNGGSRAKNAAMSLAQLVKVGDFSEIDETLLDVSSYIFTSDENRTTKELIQQRDELQDKLQQLKSEADIDTVTICAEEAGTFSCVADGFESIGIDAVMDASPAQLEKLFEKPMDYGEDVLGKLIFGPRWYFATTVQAENAELLTVDDTTRVRIEGAFDEALRMRVESIGPEENGKCTVIFSCIQYMPEMTSVRMANAEIVFSSVKGLRVPKEAVHLDEEGQAFVYILTGLQAQVIEVDTLGETDVYYIVDSEGQDKLYEGAELIVKANDLYDGKIVG